MNLVSDYDNFFIGNNIFLEKKKKKKKTKLFKKNIYI